MNKDIYYKPLQEFVEEIYKQNPDSATLYANHFADANEIKLISNDKLRITFTLTLWVDVHFPRVTLNIKDPLSSSYYEALDEYDGGGDIDIRNLLKYLKCILSNKFIVKISQLENKVIKIEYFYYALINNKITEIRDLDKKKKIIFAWETKQIKEFIYEFEPWFKNEFTVNQ